MSTTSGELVKEDHDGEELWQRSLFGNHSSVLVPRQDRDNVRKFYCDVLGGEIMKVDPERDFVHLGDNFYIGFLYGDVPRKRQGKNELQRYQGQSKFPPHNLTHKSCSLV